MPEPEHIIKQRLALRRYNGLTVKASIHYKGIDFNVTVVVKDVRQVFNRVDYRVRNEESGQETWWAMESFANGSFIAALKQLVDEYERFLGQP